MTTSASVRRLAHAAVALAITGPAVLFGGAAWAEDPTPAPETPVVQPSVGSWIIGGTLQEGTAAQPARPAKPAAKPATQTVAKPAAKPAAVTSTRTGTTRTSTRTGTRTGRTSGTATAPDGASALPFTGNRTDALIPTGAALLVGGIVLTLAGRPRRVPA